MVAVLAAVRIRCANQAVLCLMIEVSCVFQNMTKGVYNMSYNNEEMVYDENVDYESLEQRTYSDQPDIYRQRRWKNNVCGLFG